MIKEDLNYIDTLFERVEKLPSNILDLRVKQKWEALTEKESKLVFATYKELDNILNDVLSFINVKFSGRKDLISLWNKIDFDPKIEGIKIVTNSEKLTREYWNDGMSCLNSLMNNLKREIKLQLETESKQNIKNFKLEKGVAISLIGLFFAIGVAFFGNNWLGRHLSANSREKSIKPPSDLIENIDTIIFKRELPFLENVPIIDKSLFIKHYFNDLIIGGVNIDTLSINARTKTGEALSLKRTDKGIQLDITKEPFVEFEYKKVFYSIEIVRHISINCSIRMNINPTMKLKRYSEISE